MITKELYSKLKHYCITVAGDGWEDVLQEAMLRAWRFRDKRTGNLEGWIKKIICREHYRRFERKQFNYVDDDLNLIKAPKSTIDTNLDLIRVMDRLDGNYKRGIALKVLGFDSKESADIFGMSVNGFNSVIFRANKQIQGIMKAH